MVRYLNVNRGVSWVAKSEHEGLGFNMGANMKWIVFGNLTGPGCLHNVHADSDICCRKLKVYFLRIIISLDFFPNKSPKDEVYMNVLNPQFIKL